MEAMILNLHRPRTLLDWVVVTYFWLGGIVILLFELLVVYPFYHKDPWNQPILIFHTVFASSLALLIYSYMFKVMSKDVTIHSLEKRDDEFKIGWKFCEICQEKSPPRSHHCRFCDVCVLKRDHHCYLAGYCIGFQNQRYFLALLFYASFAGIFCNIYNWDFNMSVLGGFSWTTVLSLLAPHYGYSQGTHTLYQFFITSFASIGMSYTGLMLCMLVLQIRQFIAGQVKFEMKKKMTQYALGLANTKNEIFGSSGYLVLFWPFVSTVLPGDGSYFPMRPEPSDVDEKKND